MRDNLTREGEIGEMIIRTDLTKKNYIVSHTITASSHYEVIVDIDGELKKVQIKSIKLTDNGVISVPLVNRKNSSVAKNNRGNEHKYVELVDYIAVCIKDTEDIYYIPVEDLPNDKKTQSFRTKYHKGKSQQPLIEKYKELK